MDINTALPTRATDVEAYLRKLAEGTLPKDGEYPYLFGMATVKLAEANAEIVRLRERIREYPCAGVSVR